MEDRTGPRSWDGLEECSSLHTENRHNQRSVKIVVAHFAGSLGYQGAAVTCGAMKPTVF